MKKIVAILLLISNFIQAQDLNEVVAEIESQSQNTVEYVINENDISTPFASKRFIKLEKTATIDELVKLTNYKNGAVKSLAFLALAKKKYNKLYDIILEQLKDTTTVKTRIGCVVIGEYATDYFLMLVSKGTFERFDLFKLSDLQQEKINSLLIKDKTSKLLARTNAILKLESIPENYDFIKQLVKQERNSAALGNLAKFKKQNDKKLIASFFNNEDSECDALNSSIIFNDEFFYRFIVKDFKKNWKKNLYSEVEWQIRYQALVNYPRKETFILLEKITKETDTKSYKYRILGKSLLIAISRYSNANYDYLKSKIILDEDDMEEVNIELKRI